MKRLALSLIFVLGVVVSSMASAYQGDVIYIDGEKWTLMGQPIERFSPYPSLTGCLAQRTKV